MSDTVDIAIVGAGAAGLATAIFAGQAAGDAVRAHGGERPRIVLLDGAKKVGAKILVAGGGRCNVTNREVRQQDYNGPKNPVRNVLRAFGQKQAVAWFEAMGVRLKTEDTGKLFPVTDSARTVLDALLARVRAMGVELREACRVTGVHQPRNGESFFTLDTSQGQLLAKRVVLATGGRSLPKTGSDGQGWAIARRLGHTVTDTHAALVPLVLDSGFFHASLSGVSHEAELATFVDGKLVDRRTGSMLWTHFGISGPVAMDASRFWVIAHAEKRDVRVTLSMLPGEDFALVDNWLTDAGQQGGKRERERSVARLLAERMPQRVAHALLDHAGLAHDTRVGRLSRDARRQLVHALTQLELPIANHRGWNAAEVTAGGVPMSEVDFRTMQSRVVDGLYLVGEMLDVDGRIGGFNFQWAWATGHLAGTAAGRALADHADGDTLPA